MTNAFSRTWFATFLETIPASQTDAEVAFLMRQLPLESFPRVLDVCCGSGRHANRLAAAGYDVVGVERDEAALRAAQSAAAPGARFVQMDVRELDKLDGAFDAAISLWASFGWFDDATDARILEAIHDRLRPGGRLLIDVYNRDHLAGWPAEENVERGGKRVRTTRRWRGERLTITLEYEDGAREEMAWRVYTPPELMSFVERAGYRQIGTFAWFDERRRPSAEHARMQALFESTGYGPRGTGG